MIILRGVTFNEASKWSWPENVIQQSTQEYLQIQGIRDEVTLDLGPSSLTSLSSSVPSSSSPTAESNPNKLAQPTKSSQKERHYQTYLQDYKCGHVITMFFASEAQTFQEATKDENSIEDMDEEIKMMEKNHTWELVVKP